MESKKLEKLFNPNTIAVIGATNNKGTVGYSLMKNMIGNGYEGIVYPINPKRRSVQGVKAYPSVSKTPDKVDLAIIATPANTVVSIVKECAIAGVKNMSHIRNVSIDWSKKGKKIHSKMRQKMKQKLISEMASK